MPKLYFIVSILFISLAQSGVAAQVSSILHLVSVKGIGDEIGTVTFLDTKKGLLITPNLINLSPGYHGFHIHQDPSCLPGKNDNKMAAAISAGGHLDLKKTNIHSGPYVENSHLGDLPRLMVDQNGIADVAFLAPKLSVNNVINHAVVIHAGGDNYSDKPLPLGGGGARIACGIVSDNKDK